MHKKVLVILWLTLFQLTVPSLSKGIVNSKHNELQLVPNKTNYINRVYDLRGKELFIPDNCHLVFTPKGKIVNGIIRGNNTSIKCVNQSLGVKLSGTWNVKLICDDWFDTAYLSDDDIINNINILQSDTIVQTVTLNKDNYYCSIDKQGGSVIYMTSSTILNLNTCISLKPNSFKNYSIISIAAKRHVTINGGTLIGDVTTHIIPKDGVLGEWGMGILVNNSKNIQIDSIVIKQCWGDGVYIGGAKEKSIGEYKNASKNITLRNVTCDDNRRQGLSVTHVDGLLVENCSFVNTGKTKYTSPAAGIDIEPNLLKDKNQSCRNIVFKNCISKNNLGSSLGTYNCWEDNNRSSIEKVTLTGCSLIGPARICASEISFKSCYMQDIDVFINSSSVAAYFDDCEIVLNKSNIREKKPKRRYQGRITVRMNNCKISMPTPGDFINNKKWRQIDDLKLNDCTIILPKKAQYSVNRNEIITVLGNSQIIRK